MEKIRIGILGAGRSATMGKSFALAGAEVVALCDFDEKRLSVGLKRVGESATPYTDFDKFIEHDMDAVLLSNCFHEHSPLAIKCFEKGIINSTHDFIHCKKKFELITEVNDKLKN